jgi:starch phosphorylase
MKNFEVPYSVNKKYNKKAAYFSMEFAIEQSLKIYSGGLGFLAGSHMRSAYELKQNLIGIGILWKYGYYDQIRKEDQTMNVLFMERKYNFLEETNIRFQIEIHNHPVWVKVFYLNPETFGTAPIFFLTTDDPENDFLAKSTSFKLYDVDESARIAQYLLLGIGGAKLIDELGFNPDYYHYNEAHALPAAFYLLNKLGSVDKVKERTVFTTHTPEDAGNARTSYKHLHEIGFFAGLDVQYVKETLGLKGDVLNHTEAALKLSKKANAVSKLHGEVAREMWKDGENLAPITHITNAQNAKYWADKELYAAIENNDDKALIDRKKTIKAQAFKTIADQTGKLFNPDVLTIVWARRFAEYKRPDLLLHDDAKFLQLLANTKKPIQVIWGGKPYPFDFGAIEKFNKLVRFSFPHNNCTVVAGYELAVSRIMKQAADIWLNTPRITREASGTSGMTAAMNGAINFSTWDGWICEFGKHLHNSFIIPALDHKLPTQMQDDIDLANLIKILENDIIESYYKKDKKAWLNIMKNSMKDVLPFFDSDRMADEYYQVLYQ